MVDHCVVARCGIGSFLSILPAAPSSHIQAITEITTFNILTEQFFIFFALFYLITPIFGKLGYLY
jgi:hypothetical protein